MSEVVQPLPASIRSSSTRHARTQRMRMKPAPVDGLVRVIVKALESGSPDPRYVVGRDAGGKATTMVIRNPGGAPVRCPRA